jgi:hypothetical protein
LCSKGLGFTVHVKPKTLKWVFDVSVESGVKHHQTQTTINERVIAELILDQISLDDLWCSSNNK